VTFRIEITGHLRSLEMLLWVRLGYRSLSDYVKIGSGLWRLCFIWFMRYHFICMLKCNFLMPLLMNVLDGLDHLKGTGSIFDVKKNMNLWIIVPW